MKARRSRESHGASWPAWALSPWSPQALSTPAFPRSLEHTKLTRRALPSPQRLSSPSLDGPQRAPVPSPGNRPRPLSALLAGHEVVLPSVGSWFLFGPGLWRGRPGGARMMTVTVTTLSLVPDPLPGTGEPSGNP